MVENDLVLSEPVYVLKANEMRELLRRLTPVVVVVATGNNPTKVEEEILFKVLTRGYMKMPDVKMYSSC
ncbi:TPA: hypothetical protein DEW47_02375 [Patescibacteria group bacterium]|nr:MAG: hypothetical protein UT71_C0008G0011 [Parcubacteria group bacterium GW2011_GWF2_40_10]KKR47577.1 MAG: hypothetical protein UT83_C0007G0004 [Parcubacteria group bacterium GW2011_GWA2_40_143]KKR60135.1 MAG: hypothetical protein UT97_C0004G0004 [Parcubacteria group bacterium GW2011_GWC2_40_31]KKR77230.1 MAG: hypothetical protein UU20_C0012G0004 [Parcubacteria group bacterium GW2011_GWE2_40_8]KKR81799.1 MAG: hypothetical protein UU28_C0019G0004 [Parcubacteria group bacterium GW2011_GWD2_40_